MNDRGISRLLDLLRRRAPLEPDLAPDGVLLGKYADARDEPAFELLVRRHGPLVWSAVRRILRDEHAAEDALQATFLTLARKAHALRGSKSVAGWLSRVAVRVALRARPKARPTPPAPEADGDPALLVERMELIAVVDEEVNRLPERMRQAVVLCCFSGNTTEEAAKRLGCPPGTILSRLHHARERLRQQLSRRGFEAAAIGPLLAECGPAPLTSSLIAIAARAAGPVAALSPVAITLAQGAWTAMLMTKVKIASLALVAAAALGISANHWARAVSGEPQAAKEKPVTARADEPKPATIERDRQAREDDLKAQIAALDTARKEQERLEKSEQRLWKVLDDEEENRRKLRTLLTNDAQMESIKQRLEIMKELEKPILTKSVSLDLEIEAGVKEIEKLIKEKADDKVIDEKRDSVISLRKSASSLQPFLDALKDRRRDLNAELEQLAVRNREVEAQIRRSELREQLELEKYRKLLK